ncbi:MAG TPA: DNA gyrase inhibitor YacG [Porticoccaceae bacterium]|nr:DNA gyrase inhibitor YacG [Porticoccaceae bacterium]
MPDNIVLQCPECKTPVHWNEQYPHRPFCSARCKQLDFGDWANGNHRIAGDPAGQAPDQAEEWDDEDSY